MTLFTAVNDTSHRAFCGPAAISALTGVPVSRIETMIRRTIGGGGRDAAGRKLPIKGTYAGQVRTVLERLGCKVTPYQVTTPLTFRAFVEDTATIPSAFLVEVTGHWMASFKGRFADSSNYDPKPIAGYTRATRRVCRAWTVTAPETPKYTTDAARKPREKRPKPPLQKVRADRLADQIKSWEAKKRRAENALKKLRPKLRRYERLGVTT